ncbi:hypothetical protein RMSM_06839 [Rhodopirellula maiorica SM1]|uniref:Uncharacterized protein n=1 Tax=Rhodopirellula maiorica SM1 TaxID=1265738 RepID=M5RLH7_9BACT|nr:hypothetical protein RMSM_06839 [Rhodopirellula maiorica SM1]
MVSDCNLTGVCLRDDGANILLVTATKVLQSEQSAASTPPVCFAFLFLELTR